jgi:hypothetical protein
MVPSSICLPAGQELSQVLYNFEALCHLPQCAGRALDGTFMRIEKPLKFVDSYKKNSIQSSSSWPMLMQEASSHQSV